MTKVSVIIRTKNEEKWIRACLTMVFKQAFKDFEVILVDNLSSDRTLDVARQFPIKQALQVDVFKPGHALNLGMQAAEGDILVCLSAHCIPKDEHWLSRLVQNFNDPRVAGVYGRQLPLPFSEDADKRDLLITFGLDRKRQIKDYFFHNANSAIRREVWEEIPFVNHVPHIEDRLWAKEAVGRGYHLIYEPDAAVYHYHGIHQNQNSERIKNVVLLMEHSDEEHLTKDLPATLKPEALNLTAILPVWGRPKHIAHVNLLENLIENIKSCAYVNSIFLLADSQEVREIASQHHIHFMERPQWLNTEEKSLEDALQYAVLEIEKRDDFPQAILYANYLYPFRPQHFFCELIQDRQRKGLDTVFAGLRDYHNYWRQNEWNDYDEVGERFEPRLKKEPIYQALYGLGCISSSASLREGKLISGRKGIFPVDNGAFALKSGHAHEDHIIQALFFEKPHLLQVSS